MSDVVLAIDADWDLVTQYGHAFRDRFVFAEFSQKWPEYQLHRLSGLQAVQPAINTFLTEHDVRFVTAAGHGVYDTFRGYQDQLIWSATQDLALLQGAIVHLLSCQTGTLLGRSMVAQEVRAFWGYTINFSFFRKTTPPADLAEDKTAEIFLKMDCIVDRGILSKKPSVEIHNSVASYVASVSPQLKNPLHRAALLDNYLHLVGPFTTWGDAEATL